MLESNNKERQKEKAEKRLREEQDACEEFMLRFFKDIVQPLLEKQVLPQVNEIIEDELESVNIKSKYTK